MSGVYSFRAGPTYRGATREEMLDAALSQPFSLAGNIWEQAKGGVLSSYGLGTAIKDFTVPEGEPTTGEQVGNAIRLANPITAPYEVARRTAQAFMDQGEALDEEAYKASPYYREGIPWDAGMTDERAAALAMMDDAKKVREFYASKRPISSFIGNLAGQAVDPINYIPVAGPAVKAAAVARLGKIGGAALHSAVDAAANTALFGIGTRERRGRYGDDVSWQATVSQIATAALIGAAFGTLGGAWEARSATKGVAAIEERLATLKTTQEARIALNEAIDGLARGEDVALSPNAAAAMERVQQEIIAYHGSPHTFDRFSMDKIGTGEGAQAFGHGLYFAEKEAVGQAYRNDITAARIAAAERALKKSGGDVDAAIAEATAEVERLRNLPDGGGDTKKRDRFVAINEEKIAELTALKQSGRMSEGNLYEVGIRADPDDFLDWDKPLSEQSPKVQAALSDMKSEWTGGQIYESSRLVPGEFADKKAAAAELRKRGIAGIKYLDKDSRSAGSGSRNLVVFDDSNIRVRARNGKPIDQSPPRADPIPEGRAQAETRITKPDDAKALATQYGVDPSTGAFSEEAEITQLATEGRLTENDAAALADAQATYEDGAAYGEALKAAVACLI